MSREFDYNVNYTIYFERNYNYNEGVNDPKVKGLNDYHYYMIDNIKDYIDYEYFNTLVVRTGGKLFLGNHFNNCYDMLGISESNSCNPFIRHTNLISRKVISQDIFNKILSKFSYTKINYTGTIYALLYDHSLYTSTIFNIVPSSISYLAEKNANWYTITIDKIKDFEFNVTVTVVENHR